VLSLVDLEGLRRQQRRLENVANEERHEEHRPLILEDVMKKAVALNAKAVDEVFTDSLLDRISLERLAERKSHPMHV